ncbi:hypothetical protein JAAARDRAFT_47494 [Jaapia argillacea MUCL 33604]|uniref:Spindle pole body component n=1 Tax=Jaapia argillacea MUCL 33604 TaxID=933084 RepID=A0A067PS66_9AGAM|nr:hypothetical protein JAAARDRAFT_47494 [Jaapia argillacea MUCL 33604]
MSLPDIPHHDPLPEVLPLFYIPKLADKPQDPIMDTIDLLQATYRPAASVPLELALISQAFLESRPSEPQTEDIWHSATKRKGAPQVPATTFTAALYHTQPPFRSSPSNLLYVNFDDLYKSLKMALVGSSSPLFIWHPSSEIFRLPKDEEGLECGLSIEGKNELTSASSSRGTTTHAFAYSMSTVLDYLTFELSQDPFKDTQRATQLSALWMHYADYDESLTCLSKLCFREYPLAPSDYSPLPDSPSQLLSHIYTSLEKQIEKASSQIVKAILAFILTATSHDYLRIVCRTVGYGSSLSSPSDSIRHSSPSDPESSPNVDEDNEEHQDPSAIDDVFPSFFPPDLAITVPSARKSLVLLHAAQPDHPMLTRTNSHSSIDWFWTPKDIEEAWCCTMSGPITAPHGLDARLSHEGQATNQSRRPYKPELSDFHIFDIEPGSDLLQLTSSKESADSRTALRSFIAQFPSTLPMLTPTLTHLAGLVLRPLLEHTKSLSSALLSTFLSPTSYFSLKDHLILLRSHMLLTSNSFRSRLEAALFSDSEDYGYPHRSARALAVHGAKPSPSSQSQKPWAVGLGTGLTERETWPPGGADLSFYLRTVIVDSLESDMRPGPDLSDTGRIYQEAEFRLGFAIRDLPVGTGREQWLNPLSIEALDFLYMDYKPPHPLDVLITPDVLSKYQRLWTFLLRLMRVENVVRVLFRLTRHATQPLFPTLTGSNKLLLHFRYICHTFVSSFSSYVFDVAIRAHYDGFLSQLEPHSGADSSSRNFSDVFALAEQHSAVMDTILSTCLLRSGQRAVGDLLRSCLEVVLDFGVLVGELRRQRLQEYQAAPMLDDLFETFCQKMTTLVMVLDGLVEKGTSLQMATEPRVGHLQNGRLPSTVGLHDLLVRLDVGDWWKRGITQ